MKKILFMFVAASLMFCACDPETITPDNPSGDIVDTIAPPDQPVDVTPYLGTYTVTRATEAVVTLSLFSFPLNQDLPEQTLLISPDPTRESGVLLVYDNGLPRKGIVNENGLQLNGDTINLSIDTTIENYPLKGDVTLTVNHDRNIAAPVEGVMQWSADASGSATFSNIPLLGSLSGTIEGTIRYTVVRKQDE